MAKSNRTNRDRLTDDSADNQPDTPGTDAADLPLDDDLVTDVDSLPGSDDVTADSGDTTDAAASAAEETDAAKPASDDADDAGSSPVDAAAVDQDSEADDDSAADEDATSTAAADGEKTSKDAVTPAAKPAGRNRKAAGGASTSTSTKSSASKKTAKAGAKSSAKSGNPAKRAANRKTASYTSTPGTQTIKPNGRWFVPTMVTVLLLGLAWLVVFYISSGAYPVGAWGYWNLGVGFAILVAGLVMSTRWR